MTLVCNHSNCLKIYRKINQPYSIRQSVRILAKILHDLCKDPQRSSYEDPQISRYKDPQRSSFKDPRRSHCKDPQRSCCKHRSSKIQFYGSSKIQLQGYLLASLVALYMLLI